MPMKHARISPSMTVLEAARLKEREKHAAAVAEQLRIQAEQGKSGIKPKSTAARAA